MINYYCAVHKYFQMDTNTLSALWLYSNLGSLSHSWFPWFHYTSFLHMLDFFLCRVSASHRPPTTTHQIKTHWSTVFWKFNNITLFLVASLHSWLWITTDTQQPSATVPKRKLLEMLSLGIIHVWFAYWSLNVSQKQGEKVGSRSQVISISQG